MEDIEVENQQVCLSTALQAALGVGGVLREAGGHLVVHRTHGMLMLLVGHWWEVAASARHWYSSSGRDGREARGRDRGIQREGKQGEEASLM